MDKRENIPSFRLDWRGEGGNGTVLVIGMAMGILGLMLMIGAMAQVYIGKRQMQTAADAAALAAQKKLEEKFSEELADYADEVIEDFLDGIPPEEDFEQVVRSTIVREELEEAILSGGSGKVSWVVEEPAFQSRFDCGAMSRLLYHTAEKHWEAIEGEAERLARLNRAEEKVHLEFPFEGEAKIYVEVKGKIVLPIYDHLLSEDSRMIRVGAASLYRNRTFAFSHFDMGGVGPALRSP